MYNPYNLTYPVTVLLYKDISLLLIRDIGLQIRPDGLIVDQDTNMVVSIDGKLLLNVTHRGMYVNKNVYVGFDPVNNPYLMKYLLQMYLYKIDQNSNTYFPSFGNRKDSNNLNIVVTKDNNGIQYESRPFKKLGVAYMDVIFKISGRDIDLYPLDNLEV